LTKNDPRVKKYIDNHTHKEFLKVYILYFPDKKKLEFKGKKKLESFIKNHINNNLNMKGRINVDNLIKNEHDKNFVVKIK